MGGLGDQDAITDVIDGKTRDIFIVYWGGCER
jgi:hypothetical protein